MASPIRLLVGLGNPGREHETTRHNAGFWYADAVVRRIGAAFVSEGRFHGLVARGDGDLRVLKPATYMNLSGRAVSALMRFFNIAPHEMLVAHDELDLKAGSIKIKFGGGNAGHNGLRDITTQLGTGDFWRLRIGIGHPRDSEFPQQPVVDYVLRGPRPEERQAIEAAIGRGIEAWPAIAAGDFERAMLDLHTRKGSDNP
ncbi:MAG TPA: aminoacyl-tRNA hydrolase [Casimicrobiaceae bacterium]|nr:aminoacyl-tRNA hydrolase [Casimicrobiaceae bacterium]